MGCGPLSRTAVGDGTEDRDTEAAGIPIRIACLVPDPGGDLVIATGEVGKRRVACAVLVDGGDTGDIDAVEQELERIAIDPCAIIAECDGDRGFGRLDGRTFGGGGDVDRRWCAVCEDGGVVAVLVFASSTSMRAT